jgi:hypothetical protein
VATVTERAREALTDTAFPADRNTLIVRATQHGETEDVLHALTVLPEGTYRSLEDVVAGLDAEHQRGDDQGSPTSEPMDLVEDDD